MGKVLPRPPRPPSKRPPPICFFDNAKKKESLSSGRRPRGSTLRSGADASLHGCSFSLVVSKPSPHVINHVRSRRRRRRHHQGQPCKFSFQLCADLFLRNVPRRERGVQVPDPIPKFTGTESRNGRRVPWTGFAQPLVLDRTVPVPGASMISKGREWETRPETGCRGRSAHFLPNKKSGFVPTPWEALCRREKCGGFFAVGSGQPWKPLYPPASPPVRSVGRPGPNIERFSGLGEGIDLYILHSWLHFVFGVCNVPYPSVGPPGPRRTNAKLSAHLLVSIT